MPNCQEIERALAAYAEGASAAADRHQVEAHLQACPACRSRVTAERNACELLRARRTELRGCAPEALRRRCAAQRAAPALAPVPARRPWVPLSLAASLVFAAGLLVMFGLGGSVETYAAQLAVDHMKCFQFPPDGNADVTVIGEQWRAANGWPLRIAPSEKAEGLELLGIRRCGSTRGRVAHMLYRWRGQPLSVYVLNSRIKDSAENTPNTEATLAHDHADHADHAEAYEGVRKFGVEEIIWEHGGRTYTIVAQAPDPELRRIARYVRRLTH